MNPLAYSGSPGKENHARLVEGLWNWHKSDSTFVDDRVQGTLLANVFLYPVSSTR